MVPRTARQRQLRDGRGVRDTAPATLPAAAGGSAGTL